MMNYANMIEEKNLKKSFIIATLVSTLIGTFTSSMNLFERVQDKRKQEKKDDTQTADIKRIQGEIESMKKNKGKNGKRSKDDDDESSSTEDDQPRRRKQKDMLLEYLDRSPALIRREYDQGYDRWGQRFASGDVITENQLQSQIISLQQTVIHVLQDALNSGRRLRRFDVDRLVQASQSAQVGSLDALRSQYKRMQSPGQIEYESRQRRRSLPPPKLTDAATMVSAQRAITAGPRSVQDVSIYCRYSLDLQEKPHKNLNVSFAPGGESRCPACEIRIPVDGEEEWTIGKRKRSLVLAADSRSSEEKVENCEFHVTARFVVKCHTEHGEYACLFCNQNRGVDFVCSDVEGLIAHVSRKHKIGEYEKEIDLVQG